MKMTGSLNYTLFGSLGTFYRAFGISAAMYRIEAYFLLSLFFPGRAKAPS
jgi:hypothetical protein